MPKPGALFTKIVVVLFLLSPILNAQWVAVARAASKRIQHMRQTDTNGSGFEVATVLLEAKAQNVYATAIAEIKAHPDITITKTDDANLKIEFTRGTQAASLMVTDLGPKASQLVVAALVTPNQAGGAGEVVNGVMKVCDRMKVKCEVQK